MLTLGNEDQDIPRLDLASQHRGRIVDVGPGDGEEGKADGSAGVADVVPAPAQTAPLPALEVESGQKANVDDVVHAGSASTRDCTHASIGSPRSLLMSRSRSK